MRCAFCLALIASGESETVSRLTIDAAMAQPNNVSYSVASSSSIGYANVGLRFVLTAKSSTDT
jgi:hypothetical protein